MTRSRVLYLALAATLAATAWTYFDAPPEEIARPVVRRAAMAPAERPRAPEAVALAVPSSQGARTSEDPAPAPLQLPERAAPKASRRNPFDAYSWAPPKIEQAAAEPVRPPPPTLPFVFAGRLITPAGLAYLLNEGPRTHTVVVGGEVGGFRLEVADETRLVFVHIASAEKVVLAISP